jgi:hypothetical protein
MDRVEKERVEALGWGLRDLVGALDFSALDVVEIADVACVALDFEVALGGFATFIGDFDVVCDGLTAACAFDVSPLVEDRVTRFVDCGVDADSVVLRFLGGMATVDSSCIYGRGRVRGCCDEISSKKATRCKAILV